MYDKKKGDPSATAGLGPHPDQNNLDQDGKQKRAPGEEDRVNTINNVRIINLSDMKLLFLCTYFV